MISARPINDVLFIRVDKGDTLLDVGVLVEEMFGARDAHAPSPPAGSPG